MLNVASWGPGSHPGLCNSSFSFLVLQVTLEPLCLWIPRFPRCPPSSSVRIVPRSTVPAPVRLEPERKDTGRAPRESTASDWKTDLSSEIYVSPKQSNIVFRGSLQVTGASLQSQHTAGPPAEEGEG